MKQTKVFMWDFQESTEIAAPRIKEGFNENKKQQQQHATIPILQGKVRSLIWFSQLSDLVKRRGKNLEIKLMYIYLNSS